MKTVIALLLLTAAASAQAPNTGPITSKQTGEQIGTMTQLGNRFFLRDMKGELYATIVVEADKITMYDATGKVLDQRDMPPQGGK